MEYRCPKCNYRIGEVVSHTTVKVNAPPVKKEKESPYKSQNTDPLPPKSCWWT